MTPTALIRTAGRLSYLVPGKVLADLEKCREETDALDDITQMKAVNMAVVNPATMRPLDGTKSGIAEETVAGQITKPARLYGERRKVEIQVPGRI